MLLPQPSANTYGSFLFEFGPAGRINAHRTQVVVQQGRTEGSQGTSLLIALQSRRIDAVIISDHTVFESPIAGQSSSVLGSRLRCNGMFRTVFPNKT